MIKELLDFIKGLILIVVYSLGYKEANSQRDTEEMKSNLDWIKSVDEKKEQIRKKYLDLKTNYPDDWDGVERLRKANEMLKYYKTSKPSNNTNIKN